jgi:phosphoglycerate dehydrogenase-like enzyme
MNSQNLQQNLTLWTNASLPESAIELLRTATAAHRLVLASDWNDADAKTALQEADVAFGQPDPQAVITSERLRWIHITSAGYTAYDRDDVRAALRSRGAIFTNSSGVYDEPCAQHIVAMMLADARQLLPALQAQLGTHDWQTAERRASSYLLNGQTVLLLGYGAIAQRLVQLLAPFGMRVVALRRQARGDETVEIIGEEKLSGALAEADHVVNILPENNETRGFMNHERFATMKHGARFYNIGRGATIEQTALLRVLETGALSLAYLDVTTPEPLPPQHALWKAPNCFITPHTAGGHAGEGERLVQHFLRNLRAFEQGHTLPDIVIA